MDHSPSEAAPRYFLGESGALGVGELEASESFPFLSERFGPLMTSTMASRNNTATMVSIIKVLGDASLRTRKHLVIMRRATHLLRLA
jgi:hypothetical protein